MFFCLVLILFQLILSQQAKPKVTNLKNELENTNPTVFNELSTPNFTYNIALEHLKKDVNVYNDLISSVLTKLKRVNKYIHLVGIFLREQKIISWDSRNIQIGKSLRPSFFIDEKGPMHENSFFINYPPIKNNHHVSDVSSECKKSAFNCIIFIIRFAKEYFSDNKNIEILKYKVNSKEEFQARLLYPFKTYDDLISFRTSASIFMCWYTLNNNPLLRFDGKRGGLEYTTKFRDFYLNDIISSENFISAEKSFCPEKCCGGVIIDMLKLSNITNMNFIDYKSQCLDHISNPCRNIGDKSCKLSHTDNANINQLRNNNINITCDCPKGYRFVISLSTCIDIDECLEASYDCAYPKVCYNTPGSYACICAFGYYTTNYSSFGNSWKLDCKQNSLLDDSLAGDSLTSEDAINFLWEDV